MAEYFPIHHNYVDFSISIGKISWLEKFSQEKHHVHNPPNNRSLEIQIQDFLLVEYFQYSKSRWVCLPLFNVAISHLATLGSIIYSSSGAKEGGGETGARKSLTFQTLYSHPQLYTVDDKLIAQGSTTNVLINIVSIFYKHIREYDGKYDNLLYFFAFQYNLIQEEKMKR